MFILIGGGVDDFPKYICLYGFGYLTMFACGGKYLKLKLVQSTTFNYVSLAESTFFLR